MSRAIQDNPVCPVCTRPYTSHEAFCPECGWELQGGYELVPDTAKLQLRYERDLEEARLAYRERQLQQIQAQHPQSAALEETENKQP
ncbi:MAG: hypothetical protein EI684_09280, partial [Candidatus Viridilinea halotolerans]